MFSCKERVLNTIEVIKNSDEFDDNWELFNKGISILEKHDCKNEFDDEDREIIEEIFTIIS